jgi:hypothetical protein
MWFFASLIPATIWVVLGYFILFSSTKSEGALQKFGQILADERCLLGTRAKLSAGMPSMKPGWVNLLSSSLKLVLREGNELGLVGHRREPT